LKKLKNNLALLIFKTNETKGRLKVFRRPFKFVIQFKTVNIKKADTPFRCIGFRYLLNA